MLRTDFESHRIQGFTNATGERIDVPLISEIEPGFFQGGCVGGVHLPPEIDFILSLYKWEQYLLNDKQIRKEIKMYDHDGMPDLDQLHQLADEVNTRRKDSTVLVHCQAGLNRSGLVAGLALIKSGMKPQDAIDLLRSKRCSSVLCNKTFERYLLSL